MLAEFINCGLKQSERWTVGKNTLHKCVLCKVGCWLDVARKNVDFIGKTDAFVHLKTHCLAFWKATDGSIFECAQILNDHVTPDAIWYWFYLSLPTTT